MANITKRLNFFTGFFTTAGDWQEGQEYHIERRKLHNRRLHTPGVMRGELDELQVTSNGGMNVLVRRGAALDAEGHEIYLDQSRTLTLTAPESSAELVYIALRYHEQPADRVVNVENDQYSGDTRIAEIPTVELVATAPDNLTSIELARIDVQPGATEISDAADRLNPGGNEIDRRFVRYAGSVAVTEEILSAHIMTELIQVMQDGRRDFAALHRRFPVPSNSALKVFDLTFKLIFDEPFEDI